MYLEEMWLDRVGMERAARHLGVHSLEGIVPWLGHHSLSSGLQFYWLKNLIFVSLFGSDLALGAVPPHQAKH